MGDLRGRVVLVTFLDTACTETCPIIASQISASLRLLPPGIRREVVALAISVEPRTDTAEHVHAFLAKRRALGLDYLIGTPRELRPVWRAFAILPAYDTGDADVHSADVRVFDRTGIWVSTLHAGVDLTPANLAHDIRRALAD